jgi:hypothetical protein
MSSIAPFFIAVISKQGIDLSLMEKEKRQNESDAFSHIK